MSGPIRGLHDVEGQLFAVCGRTLYQISNAGVAIPRGTIPGVGRVSMAHNQRSTGNELIVVNGSGGYVWNTGTQTFSVVTDEGYPGASVVDFIDGYMMQVEPFGRFLFHSNLADALDYNTLDRFEAETAPDRTLGMIVNHQEVWAFGERSIDVFGNAGTAQGTFQNKGVSISRGCAAKWSPAVIDNGVAWLGDDLKVYHAVGYGPVRISTRAIEVALSECSRTDLRNAFSFVWEDLSHAVYYLTVPNGPTFGYDFSTGLWHRRASWHPERDIAGRWRLSDLVRHNGRWIGGDYQTGKLYELDWDYMLEGCEPLVRERVSPVAHNDGRGFVLDSVEAFFDTAGASSECVEWPQQPAGPQISGEAPDGSVGVAYSGYTYTETEGDAPIVDRRLVEGAFPPGLDFDASTLTLDSGVPTEAGQFTSTIEVVDANGLVARLTDVIGIDRGPYWNRLDRTVGEGYDTIISHDTKDGGSQNTNISTRPRCEARGYYSHATGVEGLRYFEVELIYKDSGQPTSNKTDIIVGLLNQGRTLPQGVDFSGHQGVAGTSVSGIFFSASGEEIFAGGSTSHDQSVEVATQGSRAGVLVNLMTRRVWVSIDGRWAEQGSPGNNITPSNPNGLFNAPLSEGAYCPWFSILTNTNGGGGSVTRATLRLHQYTEEMMYLPEGAVAWGEP